METSSLRVQYKVGIFVAAGLIAVMAAILALGGNKAFLTRYVHLKAQFSQVQGLFAGSVVSLAGMPVGNVKKIYFVANSNKLEVEMQIESGFASRLRQGTTAEIRTQGALGDKFLYLTPGLESAPELPDGTMVPAVDDGDFLKMITSKDDGIGRAFELIKEMHLLVANLNANGRVTGTADNLRDVSLQLKTTLGRLDGLIGDLRNQLPENKKLKQAVASLASVLEKVDNGKGTLGALINDPSLHQNLKAFLGPSPRSRYLKEMVHGAIRGSENK